MKPIIEVNHLSKKYKYGESQPYYTLRDILADIAKTPFRYFQKNKQAANLKKDEFWALKDISFKVNQGEAIGIIGPNGAGKSTLLKILSQITPPTSGEAILRGRVGSLLEVGTGFQQELTGRENIYLNGAILGMTRREINNKFDEIVDFSGVEKFLDTPVKHYSSGMYVRLAFAVAAHLESEILLVDEVLAVGDAQFQKKCLGKMSEVTKQGRTVLFVSHNLNSIEELCNRCLLLDKGKLINDSNNVRSVINKYIFQEDNGMNKIAEWVNKENQYNNPWFKPELIYIGDDKGNKLKMPLSGKQDIYLYIKAMIERVDPALTIGYAIYNEEGLLLYWSYQTDTEQKNWPRLKKGSNFLKGLIPKHLLNEGAYFIEVIGGLYNKQWLFEPRKNVPQLIIRIKGGLSDSPYWTIKRPGVIAPIVKWTIYG